MHIVNKKNKLNARWGWNYMDCKETKLCISKIFFFIKNIWSEIHNLNQSIKQCYLVNILINNNSLIL